MVTTAFWVRGYCRIGSVPTERNPSTRMNRLMTIASTGSLMKISVNFIVVRLLIRRRGIGIVRRLYRIVDDEARAVAQLELAGADHGVAGIYTFGHPNLIAARLAGGDEGLVSDELVLAVLGLGLLDQEHRAAIGIVGDRGLRQRDKGLRLA